MPIFLRRYILPIYFAAMILIVGAWGVVYWSLEQMQTALPVAAMENQRNYSSMLQLLTRLSQSSQAMQVDPSAERTDEFNLALDASYSGLKLIGPTENPLLTGAGETIQAEFLEVLSEFDRFVINPEAFGNIRFRFLNTRLTNLLALVQDTYLLNNRVALREMIREIQQIDTLRMASLVLLGIVVLPMIGMVLLAISQRRMILLLESTRDELTQTGQSLTNAQQIAHLGSWEYFPGGDRMTWSDEFYRICGFEPNAVTPTYSSYLELVHPEDRESVSKAFETTLESGTHYILEHRLGLPDGREKAVLGQGETFKISEGDLVLRGTLLDITERKIFEDQLRLSKESAEQASDAKSHFLANMSHELRTPLTAIIGYSELLMEDAMDDQISRDLDRIHQSGSHLLGLINEVLDLAKIESGKMSLEIEEFGLEQLLESALAASQPMIDRNRNKLIIERPPEDIPLRTDVVKLKQILLNLLSNAAKFTEKGEIRLTVAEMKKAHVPWISFTVQDTGIGIAEDAQCNVFVEFSQVNSGRSSSFTGTGLGLPISKRFSEMLGGSIQFSSKMGEGTTFRVEIPRQIA